ncbi:N-acyl-phosphatidylethanolamine-hydrolyzing phospholipase D [Penicillium chermesinum]|nr:N-acyl-phosphatidylethanolamine-hydrolyzing phospholipase D [Penicillium chermesinum]
MRGLLSRLAVRATSRVHIPSRMMGSTTTQVLYALTVATSPKRPVPEDAALKSHHAASGFRNPWDSWRDVNFASLLEVVWRRITGKANVPDAKSPGIKVRKPEFLTTRNHSKLRATWLGHACYHVEFPSGLRVLFDPVLEEHCGPYNLLGPKRFTEAPCKPEDIPVIDAVVISHNHYDHLSYHTVSALAKKHSNCHFFVPLGNKQWFERCGIEKVTELDWWDECDVTLSPSSQEGTKVEAAAVCPVNMSRLVPPFDRNKTLWCSWAIESEGSKVYFAGDTGMPAFKQVGEYRGPFDLGLIPIGAYAPRYVWSSAHGDPHDAVSIFKDTKCKKALGIHWGTWVLTEEDVLEPPQKLKTALRRFGLPETGVFDTVDIGESREFDTE